MRVIGLHGLPQSGKDTIADHLCEKHGFARVAFAGPIKDGLIAMFGLTRENFDSAKKEFTNPRIGMSPRRLMQTLGTEWARNTIDNDIWIRMAAERVEHMKRYAAGIVVTDVRFENEAAWVRGQGGEIWHVLRGYKPYRAGDHASNAGVVLYPNQDAVIFNSGKTDTWADELHAEIEKALSGASRGSERIAVQAQRDAA